MVYNLTEIKIYKLRVFAWIKNLYNVISARKTKLGIIAKTLIKNFSGIKLKITPNSGLYIDTVTIRIEVLNQNDSAVAVFWNRDEESIDPSNPETTFLLTINNPASLPPEEGIFNFKFLAIDNFGNQAYEERTYEINFHVDPPIYPPTPAKPYSYPPYTSYGGSGFVGGGGYTSYGGSGRGGGGSYYSSPPSSTPNTIYYDPPYREEVEFKNKKIYIVFFGSKVFDPTRQKTILTNLFPNGPLNEYTAKSPTIASHGTYKLLCSSDDRYCLVSPHGISYISANGTTWYQGVYYQDTAFICVTYFETIQKFCSIYAINNNIFTSNAIFRTSAISEDGLYWQSSTEVWQKNGSPNISYITCIADDKTRNRLIAIGTNDISDTVTKIYFLYSINGLNWAIQSFDSQYVIESILVVASRVFIVARTNDINSVGELIFDGNNEVTNIYFSIDTSGFVNKQISSDGTVLLSAISNPTSYRTHFLTKNLTTYTETLYHLNQNSTWSFGNVDSWNNLLQQFPGGYAGQSVSYNGNVFFSCEWYNEGWDESSQWIDSSLKHCPPSHLQRVQIYDPNHVVSSKPMFTSSLGCNLGLQATYYTSQEYFHNYKNEPWLGRPAGLTATLDTQMLVISPNGLSAISDDNGQTWKTGNQIVGFFIFPQEDYYNKNSSYRSTPTEDKVFVKEFKFTEDNGGLNYEFRYPFDNYYLGRITDKTNDTIPYPYNKFFFEYDEANYWKANPTSTTFWKYTTLLPYICNPQEIEVWSHNLQKFTIVGQTLLGNWEILKNVVNVNGTNTLIHKRNSYPIAVTKYYKGFGVINMTLHDPPLTQFPNHTNLTLPNVIHFSHMQVNGMIGHMSLLPSEIILSSGTYISDFTNSNTITNQYLMIPNSEFANSNTICQRYDTSEFTSSNTIHI